MLELQEVYETCLLQMKVSIEGTIWWVLSSTYTNINGRSNRSLKKLNWFPPENIDRLFVNSCNVK